MKSITLQPIGTIHTPFKDLEGMPIQPSGAVGVVGRVVVNDDYAEGLNDIDGFSHIILIYQFHHSEGFNLTVKPFLDNHPRGLFATRAPRRPNPIGLSVVALTGRNGNVLHVRGIDVLDGTPLLDIKPFVPAFDAPTVTAVGWLADKAQHTDRVKADDRFKTP
ncbi:MAG: tRNA (N6-threonylcarbamoyladenosine(37)-N6)-methyltransferase TrmO [Desulfatitalea sp.]|nr:tRNA (N6-threonylcarbamoyladenosine(37)-N6)-methyltransferase TrmO [Desulfatitalea sp.]